MPSVQVQLSEIQEKIHNTTSNKVSTTIIQIFEKILSSKINSSGLSPGVNAICGLSLLWFSLFERFFPGYSDFPLSQK